MPTSQPRIASLLRELQNARRRMVELESRLRETSAPPETDRYRSLFLESRDAIASTAWDGTILEANPAAFELFGRSQQELVGGNFLDFFIHAEERDRFIQQLGERGSVKGFEASLYGNNHRVISARLAVMLRRTEQGEPIGFQGSIIDVTEERRTLARLRQSEALFRSLSDNAPDIIYTLNRDGVITFVNAAWERILGHPPGDVLGRYFIDFIPQEEHSRFRHLFKLIRDGNQTLRDVEAEFLDRDGAIHQIAIVGSPNLDAEGNVTGMVGLIQDETGRRRAERALEVQKAYTEDLIEGAPEAIVVLDHADRVIRVNPEFTRLFGYENEEARGRQIDDLIVPSGMKEEGISFSKQTLTGHRVSVCTQRCHKHGRLLDVSILATPIMVSGGLVGIYAIYRDNSDQIRAEKALKESESRYKALLEAIPDPVMVFHPDGRVFLVNPAFESIFGWHNRELAGKPLDFVPDCEVTRTKDFIDRTLCGECVDFETKRLTKDRRLIEVQLKSATLHDAEGALTGVIIVARDITKRKLAEEALRQSEEKWRTVLENIEDGYYELDLAGNFTFATEVTARIAGMPRNEFIGKNYIQYCNGENGERLFAAYKQVFETGSPVRHITYPIILSDGTRRLLEASASLMQDRNGQPVGFCGIIRDMTARRAAEEALRESESRHRTVLETAPDPMIVRDADSRVIYVNPAFSHVFGWSQSELAGYKMDVVPQDFWDEALAGGVPLAGSRAFSGMETRRSTKDGRIVDVSISGAVFYDGGGQPQGSVVTLQDITERKKAEEELKFVAYHDLLTELPNRKSFYMILEDTLNQSRRRSTQNTWALLFLDLDRFKHINDTLGHDAGDLLLQMVAERIQGVIRRTDHLFRLGGDEFTIILTNLTRDIDVAKVAEKIRSSLARSFRLKGHDVFTAVSIGIAVFPDDGEEVEVLVRNADLAMYAAKEEGVGYRFYTEEMNIKAIERLKLESSLRSALGRDEFVVYYQPLVNQEGRILGMEALVRWQHPEMGLIPPSKFISLAEETGAIVPIGCWVLEAACRQARSLRENGHADLYVTVNLSARQLREPSLVENILEVIDRVGLDPSALKLEVTESGVMEDPELAISTMQRLRAHGIGFSMDDFGTGYSSLSYLKRFPIDTLKIDRSFIIDALTDKGDQEIIKTIIVMAQNLAIETVAEGVETAEQQDFLCGQGCRVMQGYLYSQPLPADEFEALLNQYHPLDINTE